MNRKTLLLNCLAAALLIAGCSDDATNTGESDAGLDPTPDARTDIGDDAAPPSDATDATDIGVDVEPPEPPVAVDWPTSPEEFAQTSTQAAYVNALIVPELVGGTPDCCIDYGEASAFPGPDNSLTRLAAQADSFGLNAQELVDSSLSTGRLIVVLEHRQLDGTEDADGFALSWLRSRFAQGTNFESAKTGGGSFLVGPDNFAASSGEPLNYFNPAQMQGGSMSAGPGDVSLLIPFGPASVDIPVYDAMLEATATVTDNGVTYAAGEMGGYVTLDDLFGRLNLMVEERCECLGLGDTPLYEQQGEQRMGNCVEDASDLCTTESERLCRVLAGTDLGQRQVCRALPGILEKAADIDFDGNGDYEALSIGFRWTAVPAKIDGVTR